MRDGPRLRILVADDDRDTVITLTALLGHEGHETRGIDRALDVEPAVRSFEPDAVLLDIAMPMKDGYEIARSLHRELGLAVPLLVAVTAYSRRSDKALAQQAGFHHHVGKPYDTEEILAILADLIVPARRP